MTNFEYHTLDGVQLKLMTQEERNMRVLRGRSLLNEQDNTFTFIQNDPRPQRSVEVTRTKHSRMVRRPDKLYTLTFRFSAEEKYILSALQAEIRTAVKAAIDDYAAQEAQMKREEVKNA